MTEPLYIIKDLTYEKGKRQVLSIRNFEIHRGIIYAITGPPGTGKSSLLEILAAQVKPSAGTMEFEGEDIRAANVKQTFKAEVFYLPQSSLKGRGLVKRHMLKNIKTASWSNETAESRLDKVVRQMNLNEKLPRKLNSLSPGERRWVDLAICIASDARVLIIDELEQHMGYDDLENLKRLLQRKCNYEGTTIILGTLSPMTIRKMTGITVTLDRGKIATIRSVRDGARTRGPSDRDRNRSRGTSRGRDDGRPRGGARSNKEPSRQSDASSQGGSSGGGRKPRTPRGDSTTRPPRRENSSAAPGPRQDRSINTEPLKEGSQKPSPPSARPTRAPRKPRRESKPKKAPFDGNTATPAPPIVEQPKEVDGNVKKEPTVAAAPPAEVDGNRLAAGKSGDTSKSKKPVRRVGRGRGKAKTSRKPGSGTAAAPSAETEQPD